MKKVLLFLLILAFCIPQFACGNPGYEGDDKLHSVSSLSDIKELINKFESSLFVVDDNYSMDGAIDGDAIGGAVPENDSANSDSKGPTSYESRYSTTNSQVDGVDEGDIVKVDGASIYKLSQNGFVIVNVDKGAMEIACKIERDNYVPKELYILGDKLIMIGGVYEYFYYSGSRSIAMDVDCCEYISYSKTEIAVYDISDKSNPKLERSLTYNGYYLTSRLIDGKLCFMLNYWFEYGDEDSYIPRYIDGVTEKEIALSDIFYFNNIPSYSYLIMANIDIENPENIQQKAYLGVFGEFYVSTQNIYAASYDFTKVAKSRDDEPNYKKIRTRILKFELESLNFKAIGFADGLIKDRYSLDEHNGYFRIATTTFWYTKDWETRSYSTVYVLDSNLKQQGKVSNIGVNEQIYSVRFNGDECSITTFQQVDPLYLIDLSNPKKPKITGELKEEGVNYYMHPVGDNLLIGLGIDTENQGNWVSWKGIKVELYEKVSGKWVTRDIVTIGTSWSYSEALYNPKAILAEFEQGYNMFGFACEVWDYTEKNCLTTQAYYVFSIDYENLKLEFNVLSNFSDNLNYSYGYSDDWYDWYDMQYSYIKRGVAIGDFLYTISDKYITSYSIEDMSAQKNQIKIADFTSARELFNYN